MSQVFTEAADAAGGTTIAMWNDTKDDTEGGTSVDGTWTQRDINTEVVNNITGASLASDTITLGAGTYRFYASSPAYDAGQNQIRLYNTTDAEITQLGCCAKTMTDGTQSRSFIEA